jgi:protein-S-isoprenylcysteine O-methyltransferase Ste14
VKILVQTSKYLFQYRAVIAVFFFILLLFYARPVHSTIGHIFVLIGLALRIWAAGYIGPAARKNEFTAEYIVSNGPYRYTKHPLYAGNFFLVLGVLLLFNPPRWLAALYIAAFVIIYAIIALGEKQYLEKKAPRKVPCKLSNLKGELSTLLMLFLIYLVYFILIVFASRRGSF